MYIYDHLIEFFVRHILSLAQIYAYLISLFFADPDLIYENCKIGKEGFEGGLELFPPGHNVNNLQPELSGRYLLWFIFFCQALLTLQAFLISPFFSVCDKKETKWIRQKEVLFNHVKLFLVVVVLLKCVDINMSVH